jgi:MATE family multidrug resistance protein
MTERTPLVLNNAPIEDDHGDSTLVHENLTYKGELFHLTRETLPISLSFALQNAIQGYSIFLAGGIGTFELGVASYGYMFASCTGSMVAIGGATALDTLCSQAFTTKNRKESVPLLGTYLQRGLLILSALFICFIAPLWWFSGRLFIALGQEQDFALATGVFLRIFIPGGLLQVIAESLKKFLQVQGSSYAVGWATTFASVVGVIANYVLIRVTQVGLSGAPIAHTIYHLSTALFLLIYMLTSPTAKGNWGGFTTKAWHGWQRFSSLALTGILTVATEWWSFEILAIMAARLDSDSIATQSVRNPLKTLLICSI